ncbi:hypothetical protein MVEG_07201 [Podila verticillata NRRL 6337]|nr:MAG: stress-activated map kinase interacting protein 1-domain-containing protein [Podila humilis]KFH66676.1 hypothetical protein MVEG_07201 [Podila verticillata NRRL 6337]
MSVLSDPAYIVHNLRLSNLRLDDRTSDKVITFPPMLLSNDYIKTAGPVFPEMQFCYSPNISHDYMMVANNSLLLGSSDACLTAEDSVGPKVKSTMGVRGKYDRRRIVAAQAAAAAAAAGLGRGGIEGSSVFPMQPAPVPAMRVPVSMAVASMESDDDIDLDDEEPVKSPPRMFPKMAIPAYIGANFAPGIFITTPSRPGSATIPEDPNSQLKSQQTSENTENTGAGTGTEVSKEGDSDQTRAQEQEAGDITIDSIASPIDLSPPDLTIAPIAQRQPSEMSDGLASPNTLVSPSPVRPNTPPPKPISTPVNGLLSEPIPLERPAPVSLLTSLIIKQKSRDDNPFAEEFLRVAGMGETTPVQLKIYLPHSDKPKDPMQVVVKREASVEDVIGYILYQYYHEGRTPHFTDDQSTVVQWNLRIVEDDGEIDDDLPAVERTLKIGRFSMNQRFAMNQFALCEATPAQVKINENLYIKSGRTVVRPKRQQTASTPTGLGPPDPTKVEQPGLLPNVVAGVPPNDMVTSGVLGGIVDGTNGDASGNGNGNTVPVAPRPDPLVASTQHYVRVRLHTNHEVKHTTTVEILPKMLVSEVVDYICLKRKMNPAEWALVVADTHHVLPLDGAAEDISNSTELALVPKSTVESILAAKRIKFGRNGAMTDIPGSGVSYLTSTEVYREYTLNRKRRGGYVGHHEQVLAIDGDYVRIMPTSTRTMLFDSGKTASYLKNTIYDCRRSRKAPSSFKLIVIRGDREKKTYEFEASSPQESQEICQRIMQLKNS